VVATGRSKDVVATPGDPSFVSVVASGDTILLRDALRHQPLATICGIQFITVVTLAARFIRSLAIRRR